ncbi:hypothetical protein TRAPUB_3110, partial [Trametes pubescens]
RSRARAVERASLHVSNAPSAGAIIPPWAPYMRRAAAHLAPSEPLVWLNFQSRARVRSGSHVTRGSVRGGRWEGDSKEAGDVDPERKQVGDDLSEDTEDNKQNPAANDTPTRWAPSSSWS